jgi:hypothetical protein
MAWVPSGSVWSVLPVPARRSRSTSRAGRSARQGPTERGGELVLVNTATKLEHCGFNRAIVGLSRSRAIGRGEEVAGSAAQCACEPRQQPDVELEVVGALFEASNRCLADAEKRC